MTRGVGLLQGFVEGLLLSALFLVLLPAPLGWSHTGCNDSGGFNIIGKDSGRVFEIRGNAGTVNINNIQSTEHGVVRSVLVATDLGLNANFIEYGWSLGPNYGEADPESFVAASVNGSYGHKWQGPDVTRGGSNRFKLEDDNNDKIWDFFLDGVEQSFDYKHNFSVGSAFGITEIESDGSGCDTGYSHWWNLRNCTNTTCSNYSTWANQTCREDNLSAYNYRKVSNAEYYTEEPSAYC